MNRSTAFHSGPLSPTACLLVLGAAACAGSIDEATSGGGTGGSVDPTTPLDPTAPGRPGAAGVSYFRSGLRRLTKAELRATIKDLVGVDAMTDLQLLPEESGKFDNDYTQQKVDQRLVESMATVAQNVARTAAGSATRQVFIGCDTTDGACLTQFITKLGRRALRRPLAPLEVVELRDLAMSQKDFYGGVELALRAFLQDPEFLYRVEIGSPAGPDLYRLDSREMATRLSYLLLGTMPNEALAGLADHDGLGTPADVAKAAKGMLDGALGGTAAAKRAAQAIGRFHGLWLGYEYTTPEKSPLGLRMRAETTALLERVILTRRAPWFEVFRSRETFVDEMLATHYGDMPRVGAGAAKWVSYGNSKRQGILGHGTFFSVGNGQSGDTSVTLRGKSFRNRLLCQEIAPAPPELKVDTSKPPPPGPGECKIDVTNRTRLAPGSACQSCHRQMDLIGLGLENYDIGGKYRTSEPDKPKCVLAGKGQIEVADAGGVEAPREFNGPMGLGQLLLGDSERVERCLVTNFLRFAVGRELRPEESDTLASYVKTFDDHGKLFDELLMAFVSAPEFGYRWAD